MIFGLFKWISRLFLISFVGLCSTLYMYSAKAAEWLPVKAKWHNTHYKIVPFSQLHLSAADQEPRLHKRKVALDRPAFSVKRKDSTLSRSARVELI